MHSRRRLRQTIINVEKKLQHHQTQANQHKRRLIVQLHQHMTGVITLSLALVFMLWKTKNLPKMLHTTKQLHHLYWLLK